MTQGPSSPPPPDKRAPARYDEEARLKAEWERVNKKGNAKELKKTIITWGSIFGFGIIGFAYLFRGC